MNKKIKAGIEYVGIIKYFILAALMSLWVAYVYFFQWWNENWYIILASIFAIYMALNMWANDVANNMWPAVWSKALTIWTALIIAAIFEASWAIIAWWDVVDTIKWWIIDKELISNSQEFIWIMLATLLWAAIWINLATFLKAPVSTTNSVVWWLIWAWIAASWIEIVKWAKIWEIAASWVISLILWWIISVIIYQSIRLTILKTEDKWKSAKTWVPIYIWIIAFIFSVYLLLKWLKPLIKSNEALANIITPINSIIVWAVIWLVFYLSIKYKYSNKKAGFFEDSKKFVNQLFNIPLIFAVALLSFAHGSNDVSNAIWPFTAIYETINNLWESTTVWIPIWIMLFWAIGLSSGLAIFWARLIAAVWSDITKIDQIRAFCIALAAASTVLLASALWLPVSSTQITLWAIFGIWLFRRYLSIVRWKPKETINISMMWWIILSWVVTLPVSAILSAITYFVIMKF